MNKSWIGRLQKDEAKKYLDQALIREEKLKEDLRKLQETNEKLAIALQQVTAANLKLVEQQKAKECCSVLESLDENKTENETQEADLLFVNNIVDAIPECAEESQNAPTNLSPYKVKHRPLLVTENQSEENQPNAMPQESIAKKKRLNSNSSLEDQFLNQVPLGDDQKMWFVDDIIGQKRINGTVHYKVKWCGPNDPTWEPEDHIEMNNGQPYVKKKYWEVEHLIGHKLVNGKLFYLVKWVNWEDPNWECDDNVNGCTSALKKYWIQQCKLQK
ncbi:hypothetical protein Ddc_14540 [Ditylenchus destructor]|nr:hypothetical protein Ddc_14540 [Ditylenchus destructor]